MLVRNLISLCIVLTLPVYIQMVGLSSCRKLGYTVCGYSCCLGDEYCDVDRSVCKQREKCSDIGLCDGAFKCCFFASASPGCCPIDQECGVNGCEMSTSKDDITNILNHLENQTQTGYLPYFMRTDKPTTTTKKSHIFRPYYWRTNKQTGTTKRTIETQTGYLPYFMRTDKPTTTTKKSHIFRPYYWRTNKQTGTTKRTIDLHVPDFHGFDNYHTDVQLPDPPKFDDNFDAGNDEYSGDESSYSSSGHGAYYAAGGGIGGGGFFCVCFCRVCFVRRRRRGVVQRGVIVANTARPARTNGASARGGAQLTGRQSLALVRSGQGARPGTQGAMPGAQGARQIAQVDRPIGNQTQSSPPRPGRLITIICVATRRAFNGSNSPPPTAMPEPPPYSETVAGSSQGQGSEGHGSEPPPPYAEVEGAEGPDGGRGANPDQLPPYTDFRVESERKPLCEEAE